MADYEKAKAYIQANFNKFSEVMTDLLDRLKAKAQIWAMLQLQAVL